MNKTYLYDLHGGCGKTSLTLNINNNQFNGTFYYDWMGSEEMECNLIGRVSKNTDQLYTLYVDVIIDNKTLQKYTCSSVDILKKNISSVTFRFVDINGVANFDTLDHEFDGMVMGGCSVNKDGTYDAILIACYGEKFGAENYGANKKQKDYDYVDKLCQSMHYIQLRDMSRPFKK